MPNTDLYRFVKSCIPSVWALEVLLLLRRNRERSLTQDAIVREMRASQPLVRSVLATFRTAGLVQETAPGEFSYAPASAVIDGYCAELEQAYRERPVSVINAIVATSTDDLQNFADAFRFRGGGGGK